MSSIGELIRLRIVLPLAERINGTCACYWLRQIEEMNTWPRDKILEWQNNKLQDLIRHAYEHTVYYRNLFDSLGIKPTDIKSADDLKMIPIVDKTIVNAHHDEFIPDNLSQFRFRPGKTGGTTGEPMFYYCDENVWGYVTAAKILYWEKTGYRYGDKFAAFGSASLFSQKPSFKRRIYDIIRREYPMNTVKLTDELCERYIKTIQHEHIKYLYGYAASLYIFTKYVKEHAVDLHQVEAVFSTSENLTDSYRELIEDTFHCKVMDCYGARDAGITAYQMAPHSYQVGYNVIAEVDNEYDKDTGSLLSTNILNYTFPLIRYRFGDEVELASNSEEEEYNGQVIRRIIGRTSDVMRLGNGHHLTATGFSMIMKEFDVVAFEFRKVGDLEVLLRIQPIADKYTAEQEERITVTFKRYIGEDCKLSIEYVDAFSVLNNGKRRFFFNQ